MVSKLGSQKHTKMLYLSTPGLFFFTSFCSKTKATPTHQLKQLKQPPTRQLKKQQPNKLKLTKIQSEAKNLPKPLAHSYTWRTATVKIQVSGIWPAWRTILHLLGHRKWGVTWHCASELREHVWMLREHALNRHQEQMYTEVWRRGGWSNCASWQAGITHWMEQEKWLKSRRQFSLLQFWALCASSLLSPGWGGQHTPFCMNELPFESFPWEGLCFSIILLILFMWCKHELQLPLTLPR